MAIVVEAREAQQAAAERRIEGRAAERAHNAELLQQPGGFAAVNSPELVAKRIDRLSRYYAGERLPGDLDELPAAAPEQVAAAALRRAAVAELPGAEHAAAGDGTSIEQAGLVLEAIIGSADFLDVRYLDAGVVAARAVGRIHIHDATGGGGFGTGSLVTPRLLLTNHHVLPDAGTARASQVEFNFQLGLDGQPLPSRIFPLDPDALFVNDQALDFALVAVKSSAGELAQFGVNRFVEADGKVGIGEFVTIVQHPQARRKEISLRENKVVDQLDDVLHYAADTEPGSSGSPVFNDQWEIVALHHASTPSTGHPDVGPIVNEGIRISRIAAFVAAHPFPAEQRKLVEQLGCFEQITLTTHAGPASAPESGPPQGSHGAGQAALAAIAGPGELAIPLQLTVGVRSPLPAPAAIASDGAGAAQEAVRIDPDYAARRGYDTAFLGMPVPLPVLSEQLRASAAVNALAAAGADPHVLPYHHFSVVLDAERRLARYTAVNIDGRSAAKIRRERDKWSLDPRVPVEQQTGEDVYAANKLDRGHLVRRLDPAWGTLDGEAKLANDDTFHFTNCTPQHEDFNQNKTTWAGLEDYILENADNRDLRVVVFTGPVLAAGDDLYKGVKLPRQFWKVVTMVKTDGQLSATAYLLSQEALLQAGLEALAAPEDFSYGAYRTFQVPVTQVEALTGLSFGALHDADPLARLEATTTAPRAVDQLEQLVL